MRSERFRGEPEHLDVPHGPQFTSFGIPLLEQEDGGYLIDMTNMRVFSGIPGFVRSLTSQVLEHCRSSPVDILVRVLVDFENTPDLAQLGLTHVVLYVRGPVARHVLENPDGFHQHLRLVFDAVQTPRWGGLLFPGAFEGEAESICHRSEPEALALLFPFHRGFRVPAAYFMLLEHDPQCRFLRLTIEDGKQSRLFLKRIPHRVVSEMGRRHYRQDIAIMAEQIFNGIHRECHNQQSEYMESPGRQAALFELLMASGLEKVTGAVFRWTQDISEKVLLSEDAAFVRLLSKILLLLEDERLVRVVSSGCTLEMVDDEDRIFLDLSRKGTMLNVSMGAPRKQPDMAAHLRRLPHLLQAQQRQSPQLLKKYRFLLIHHATSEVLGFVKALDATGCGSLATLFIRYQGVVPEFHLEDMLSLPEDRFLFLGLQRIELRDSMDGAYILSRQYSPLQGFKDLDRALRALRGNYLTSMRLAAGHLFFKEGLAAKAQGNQLVLIEDGGYLGPTLNRLCHESCSLGQALERFAVPAPPDMDTRGPLEEWLRGLVPGTLEHTTNGYQQLQAVEAACGGLTFPALSIATSRYKNVVEAEACAHSILNAVESIFNGLGRCMIHRHALVLGSRGNIGRFLMRSVALRVTYGNATGLDLKVSSGEMSDFQEFAYMNELPEAVWTSLDLFLGITGVSVLQRNFFERLLLLGTARELFFASGSTKNIEFADLTAWIEELSHLPHPTIKGYPIRLEKQPVKDPQSRNLQGHHVRIFFEGNTHPSSGPVLPCKDIYLLSDVMPVNFLYYGVPGEVIDGVFEELYSLLCGFVSRMNQGDSYAPGVYGLDVNIDKNGVPFQVHQK